MTSRPADACAQWSDDLVLGIPEIDDEHRIWVGLVGNFCAAVGEGRASDVIYAALVEALRYTENHLRHEEDFMAAQEYPYLDDHRIQHDLAKEEMHKFTTGHYTEEYLINYFCSFLPNWLLYHINTSDRKMAEWVLERQPPALTSL